MCASDVMKGAQAGDDLGQRSHAAILLITRSTSPSGEIPEYLRAEMVTAACAQHLITLGRLDATPPPPAAATNVVLRLGTRCCMSSMPHDERRQRMKGAAGSIGKRAAGKSPKRAVTIAGKPCSPGKLAIADNSSKCGTSSRSWARERLRAPWLSARERLDPRTPASGWCRGAAGAQLRCRVVNWRRLVEAVERSSGSTSGGKRVERDRRAIFRRTLVKPCSSRRLRARRRRSSSGWARSGS